MAYKIQQFSYFSSKRFRTKSTKTKKMFLFLSLVAGTQAGIWESAMSLFNSGKWLHSYWYRDIAPLRLKWFWWIIVNPKISIEKTKFMSRFIQNEGKATVAFFEPHSWPARDPGKPFLVGSNGLGIYWPCFMQNIENEVYVIFRKMYHYHI